MSENQYSSVLVHAADQNIKLILLMHEARASIFSLHLLPSSTFLLSQTDSSLSDMNSTLAEQRPFNYELQMQSVRTQLDMDRNKLLATMQSGMGAITDEMRSKQVKQHLYCSAWAQNCLSHLLILEVCFTQTSIVVTTVYTFSIG